MPKPRRRKSAPPPNWLPAEEPTELNGERVQRMHEGEPFLIRLRRWDNARTVTAQEWASCCGCGFRHLLTYCVFRSPDGRWYLAKRAYADERTRPKQRRRAKRR